MGNKAYASYTITDLIDGLQWKGALDSAPVDPQESWAYYNTEDKCSYIYSNGEWVVMAQDGEKGDPGTVTGSLTFYCATATDGSAPDSIFTDGITGRNVKDGMVTSTGSSPVNWYSESKFFGTKDSLGAWDTRLEEEAEGRPSEYPCVWSITLIRSQADENWYKAHDPLRVSLLTAATMAARVQISNSSDEATIVAEWCTEAGLSIINGSTIVAGSITADQIAANTITAEQIDVGSLAVHNDFKVSIQSSIDDIEIGGRNLIFNSKGNSLDGWICNIGLYFGQIVTDSEKKSCIEISNTTTSELFIATPRTAVLENYENYTFSCDIWVGNYTKSVDFYFMSDTEDDQKTQAGYVNFNCFKSGYIPTVREKWHRFTQTFKMVDNAYTGYIRIDNNGTTTSENTAIVKIANIKLEKGNKATDWTPAPEDMATSAELKVTRDSISSKVESSVYESGLTQLADQMVAKVHDKESGDVCSWSMTPGGFNVSAVADGVSGGITVNKNGLTVDGTVNAQKGRIGGYTLENETLYAGNEVGYVGLDARCDVEQNEDAEGKQYSVFKHPYAFFAGSENPETAPFRVTKQGVLTSDTGVFSGNIAARAGSIGPIKFDNFSFNVIRRSISISRNTMRQSLCISMTGYSDVELDTLTTKVQGNCNYWTSSKNSWGVTSDEGSISTSSYFNKMVLANNHIYTTHSSNLPTKMIYTTLDTTFTIDEVQSDGFFYDLNNGKWAQVNIDDDLYYTNANGETIFDSIYISPGGVLYFLDSQDTIMSIYHLPSGHDFFGSTKDNLFTVKSDYRYVGSINCGNKSTALDYSESSTNNPAEGFYLDKNYLFMSGSTSGTSINVKGDIRCDQVYTNGIRLQSTRSNGLFSITYDGTNVNIDKIKSTSIVDASGYNVFGRKFYFWEYSGSVTENAPQSITISSTTHKLSTVQGAIVTPRADSDNMGNWNNIVANDTQIGVYISGTTVKICVDNGELKKGFYCLIYGW